MQEVVLTIENEEGLHARPAGVFVKEANAFKSKVELDFNGKKVNGKSIMTLMSLGLTKNAQITLIVDGEDEQQALSRLSDLIKNKFQ